MVNSPFRNAYYFTHSLQLSPGQVLWLDELFLKNILTFDRPILFFWESPTYFVVLGYGNKIHNEVLIDQCTINNIEVFRRISGGGTVLQGPGCWNYSFICPIKSHDSFWSISDSTCFFLNQVKDILSPQIPNITIRGTSDLTINNKKFSGNAQKRTKDGLLFHGTLLTDFDISLIDLYLRFPPRVPSYRENRTHGEFVCNLGIESNTLQSMFIDTLKLSPFPKPHSSIIGLEDPNSLAPLPLP